MSNWKYNDGDFIGPYKILMIERTIKKNNRWHANFKCPICNSTFESDIINVNAGYVKSCGCLYNKYKPGQRLGPLNVLFIEKTVKKNGIQYGKFQCPQKECNNVFETNIYSVVYGETKSCGCLIKNNLINERFGLLTVLDKTDKRDKAGNIIWKCQCSCNNKSIVYIPTSRLKNGTTKSCGCIKSKGEILIQSLLEELCIHYEKEKIFPNCITDTGRCCRFDFYLPDYNCCIEYDGKQHYKYSNNGWNNKKNYDGVVYRDNIKNNYCINNNISLIRIPYTDYDIIDKKYIEKRLKEI